MASTLGRSGADRPLCAPSSHSWPMPTTIRQLRIAIAGTVRGAYPPSSDHRSVEPIRVAMEHSDPRKSYGSMHGKQGCRASIALFAVSKSLPSSMCIAWQEQHGCACSAENGCSYRATAIFVTPNFVLASMRSVETCWMRRAYGPIASRAGKCHVRHRPVAG